MSCKRSAISKGIISPKNSNPKDGLAISQNATFYISNLEEGRDLSYIVKSDRITYLFVIEGKITINGKVLNTRYSAQVENEEILKIKAQSDTELILIDLPIKYMKNSVLVEVAQK